MISESSPLSFTPKKSTAFTDERESCVFIIILSSRTVVAWGVKSYAPECEHEQPETIDSNKRDLKRRNISDTF